MKSKKVLLNVIFVVIILAILLICIFVQGDIKDIGKALKSAKYSYLVISIGFLLIYLFTTAFSLDILLRLKAKINPFDSYNIANCAQFYNGITPFASGGQPFQVYYYTKVNIKPNVSTSVIMMNFIIHQLVLNVISIIAIILYFNELILKTNLGFRIAIIIGFSINFAILFILITISLSKKVKGFFIWLVGLVFSIKPLRKKKDSMKEKTSEFFDNFQVCFKELFQHIKVLLLDIVVKIISFAAYFLIPYFIFEALGVEVGLSNIPYIMWMTAFAFVIMSFMPTPGASGGAEWAFNEVFIALPGMTKTIALSAILLWRFITYYLVMILGAISAMLVKKREDVVIDENRDLHW